jgi:diguanylate cyclase (GGDEF)-like protein/PAS domain S-box-containing protein
MENSPGEIKKQLTLTVAASVAWAPIASYLVATFFGMVDNSELVEHPAFSLLIISYLAIVTGVAVYFYRFLDPVQEWIDAHPEGGLLPESLDQHLQSFSSAYWLCFILPILLIPTIHYWSVPSAMGSEAAVSLLQFMLLHLVMASIVGMPGYLHSLRLIGGLAQQTGVSGVHISMRTKMLLVGAYVPLLTTTILLKYYWWKTQFLSAEILLAWGLLGMSAIVITVIAIRSLNQSLQPVQQLIKLNNASRHDDLVEQFQPRSSDEVGYLVYMLKRLFHRLGDQENHVHAIVDQAAEGIITVNENFLIETFNPAAEELFGYQAEQIHGQPLSLIIPNLTCDENLDTPLQKDVLGRHQDGHTIVMSVRISPMESEGQRYYACLIADISKRKAAEQKLSEAEARYRNLVETAHDLVWSMDTDGYWTYLNTAAQSIYGYTPEEMQGRHFSEFQAAESHERDQTAMLQVLDGEELLMYETVHVDKEGKQRHISFNAKPLYDAFGNIVQISGTARDITDQKVFERELTYQAQHDSLTGLYNRNYFQQELERLVSRVARSAAECALLYLDLDQFKYVNDTIGHAAGDRLLRECTQMLKTHVREGDLLARFGGDEFTVLLYNVDQEATERVAENIRQLFENYRFYDSGQGFNVTCSLGATIIDANTRNADEALAQADLACHMAKNLGRNKIHIYDPEDREKDGMAEDMGWATRVRDAIDKDLFSLWFQPIYSIADGKVHDYEVLLRMNTDDGDFIMPGGFMPAAERFGLANNVDRWTVTRAIEHLSLLHENNHFVRFSINLSGRAFEDRQLLPMISSILDDSNINPSALTFEITETAAIANMRAAMNFIGKLKDIGCQFALDDFGSGFCSFTYLKHLPVDKLKIDGSFVQGLANTHVDQAMVQSMNQIAHALGKQTIAEFVENETTLSLLRDFGVDYAQGHYLGKPDAEINDPQVDIFAQQVVS